MHEAAAGTTTPPTDVISASSPAEEVSSRRLMVALLGLAILLGVGLRLKHYLARHAYWHDEASLVLNVFEKTALQLLGPLDSAQAAAPGFLLLQRGVHVVLGRSELAMRLAPFLAAIAGIAIFSLLAWRLLPPRVALLLIVLLVIMALLGGMIGSSMALGIGGELDLSGLPLVILNGFGLWAAFTTFGLAASVTFDRPGPAIGITLAWLLLHYFLEILGSLWTAAAWTQDYSLLHHFNPGAILTGDVRWLDFVIVFAAAVVPVIYTLIVFPRRDLAAPA